MNEDESAQQHRRSREHHDAKSALISCRAVVLTAERGALILQKDDFFFSTPRLPTALSLFGRWKMHVLWIHLQQWAGDRLGWKRKRVRLDQKLLGNCSHCKEDKRKKMNKWERTRELFRIAPGIQESWGYSVTHCATTLHTKQPRNSLLIHLTFIIPARTLPQSQLKPALSALTC